MPDYGYMTLGRRARLWGMSADNDSEQSNDDRGSRVSWLLRLFAMLGGGVLLVAALRRRRNQ